MTRLFLAAWPDAALRARIASRVASLPLAGQAVPATHWHLTLRFLGETALDREPALHAFCARAAAQAQALSLALDSLQVWEGPRVQVLGVSQVPAPWLAWVATLEAGVCALGFPPETRPYRPHLTLARRVVTPQAPLAVAPLTWRMEALSLCASAAGRYTVVGHWPLGPVGGGLPVE